MGDFDIWYTTQTADGTWTDPVNVVELNSPYRETRAATRPDGLEMYFTSNRPGNTTGTSGAPTLDI